MCDKSSLHSSSEDRELVTPFYTPTHEAFRTTVRRFVKREIEPYAGAWDDAGEFPRALYIKAAEIGLLGIGFPQEHGGISADGFMWVIAVQEIARAGSGGLTASLLSHSIASPPIVWGGRPEVRAKVLPEILSGR